MYILTPVILLFIAALAILILQQARPSLGYSWVIAAITSVAVWVVLVVMHWLPPMPFLIQNWNPIEPGNAYLSLELSLVSWPYAIALLALLVAVIFTSAARMQKQPNPVVWVGCLVISGVALLAIMAATPLTLVMAWVILDILELIILLNENKGQKSSQRIILSFSVKICGAFFVLVAMIASRAYGEALYLNSIPP